jgi:hypothetical protein
MTPKLPLMEALLTFSKVSIILMLNKQNAQKTTILKLHSTGL